MLLKHVKPYSGDNEAPLRLQVSTLGYDDYLGRLGTGRVTSGTIKLGSIVSISKRNGEVITGKITNLFVNEGLSRIAKTEAYAGDIVTFTGISDISIGETVCAKDHVEPMEMIHIEKPTLSMNFLVNSSPFVGRSGHLVNTRQIKKLLIK